MKKNVLKFALKWDIVRRVAKRFRAIKYSTSMKSLREVASGLAFFTIWATINLSTLTHSTDVSFLPNEALDNQVHTKRLLWSSTTHVLIIITHFHSHCTKCISRARHKQWTPLGQKKRKGSKRDFHYSFYMSVCKSTLSASINMEELCLVRSCSFSAPLFVTLF